MKTNYKIAAVLLATLNVASMSFNAKGVVNPVKIDEFYYFLGTNPKIAMITPPPGNDGKYDIKHVVIPDSVEYDGTAYEVVAISYGTQVFNNLNIETLVIKAKNFEFMGGEFADCKNLEKVEVPGGRLVLMQEPFAGCDKLTEFKCPDYTNFGYLANFLPSIKKIEFGKRTVFGFRGFACNVDTLTLHGNVGVGTEGLVGYSPIVIRDLDPSNGMIFQDRSVMYTDEIYCYETTPPQIHSGAFCVYQETKEDSITGEVTVVPGSEWRYYRTMKVYVPEESLEAYRSDPNWGKVDNILPIKTSVKDMPVETPEVQRVEWYDLNGRPVSGPLPRQITIKRIFLTDGTTQTLKVVGR